ncbi:MAG: hypothetical protein HOD99_08520, partial [Planctomycetaceae bacterium]|nr:hypothetical protein [Planctomycetaceae bacterium]
RLVFVGITRGQQEVHVSASRIRDYRGSRRISAPSVFLTEMMGEESYLCGPEAPSMRDASDHEHNQDVSHVSNDTFADYFSSSETDDSDNHLIESSHAKQTHEQTRPDGLVLEMDSEFIQAEDHEKIQTTPLRKQQVSLRPHQSPAISTANKLNQRKEKEVSFNVGDTVLHEDHGEGVVEKVGGLGPRAIGVVRFQGADRTRSFVLIHGALKKL